MKARKMAKKLILMAVISGIASVAIAANGTGEAYLQEEPAHFHEVDTDWMKSFHNPTEGLTLGLDLRLREVYNRNIFGLNKSFGDAAGENWNNYHWQRYRTRLSAKYAINEDVDLNTRLVWEFWGHCAPSDSFSSFLDEQSYDFDEAIFDHMNLQFRNAFDMPLTLTVGRQDIILGTGWLVLDGTPGDGSRTIFFDAIRARYDLSDISKLDLIYIQQYDDEDKWLQPFNHNASEDRRHLTQLSDEKGLIMYLHSNLNDAHKNELYYIYKNEEESDWAKGNGKAGQGPDADIHTIGTRFFGTLDENWSYTAEIAKQWGDREGSSLKALGGNSKMTYAFNNDQKSEVHFGYEYLSGDDPSTSADEKFDTLWGDWPQSQRGGDLQSYLWTFEGALGEVTNLHRLGIGHSFKPAKQWTLLTDYNLLWADEMTYENATPRGPGEGLNFGNGHFRGQMLTGLLTYQCCKNFRTQFLLDYFIPGESYYDDPSTDDAFFARINMEWTF
ncbi:MAG: alginate export family protein [Planctomycetota bacterium]